MTKPSMLFSIDLEDIRDFIPDGHQYQERVPENVTAYLSFLSDIGGHGTFFTVGKTARKYPGLIRDIIAEGHEIGCHSDVHKTLQHLTPESFRKDLSDNIESIMQAGRTDISGFRAPVFSMTKDTVWAYKIMKSCGLKYSSSVLAAKNPLFGWHGFGSHFRYMDGILEMPITLCPKPLPSVPLAGGVYFRMLPFRIIRYAGKSLAKKQIPLQSYLHPFDIDTKQERFMQPDIKNNKFFNYLMYLGRSRALRKLELLSHDFAFLSYQKYLTLKDREALHV
ncbi:MAG: polysaccharide deacetylase family protein [Deltaproteobacteria bacterium]|nr:polysaccharide deacetylase family protein [Deltaproteobacteria bacterium]